MADIKLELEFDVIKKDDECRKENIVIKEGKMFKGDKEISLEFGNLEQINILRKYSKKIEEFTTGVRPNCYYEVTGTASFNCICGRVLEIERIDADDEQDIECFEGKIKSCYSCKRKYEFIIKQEYRKHGERMFLHHETLLVVLTDKNEKD